MSAGESPYCNVGLHRKVWLKETAKHKTLKGECIHSPRDDETQQQRLARSPLVLFCVPFNGDGG